MKKIKIFKALAAIYLNNDEYYAIMNSLFLDNKKINKAYCNELNILYNNNTKKM